MATLVRAARPGDKAPLMEFISRIWGGHDYIPRVWDEWMRERSAKTFVVEVDGVPLGMNRVNFLEDGSAWLEGARVHPDFRGRGLATRLGKNAMRAAGRRGARVLRLTTNSRNYAAKRQIARIHFRESSRMSLYVPGRHVRFRRQSGVRKAGRRDLTRIKKTIQASSEFRRSNGIYWDGFRAISLTPEIIRRRVSDGSVYIAGDAVAILRLFSEGGERWNQICFACGRAKEVKKLISQQFNKRVWGHGLSRVLYAPQGSKLVATARKAGLVRWGSFVLYERTVPKH